jgi:serine/threonine protein kinase
MSAAHPPQAQLPQPGDMIAGKYVLDRLLGQGGMGAVFAARHLKLSKAVAIKIMLADASNPEAAQRFRNEGRAAANIQNDHVVRVEDVDEEMGYAYMVLELLEGDDLSQILDDQPQRRLPPHVAVNYVMQALRGIAQAHAIGIVHRDLKPSNLFLARRADGSTVVKVLDFGISKAQGSSPLAAAPHALTSTKAMLGSPLYMSPEQLRSSKNVDPRADIWAMGVILYELITGTLPYMADNLGELFAAILEDAPVPPRQRDPSLSPALEQIILRCLSRKPEDRFQSAMELAHALQPFLQPQRPLTNPPISSAAMTQGMGPPAFGVVTPNGSAPGVAVAPGMPQVGLIQTNSAWQSTGGGTALRSGRSKLPMILGLGAAVVFLGIAVVFLIVVPRAITAKSGDASGASAEPSISASNPSSSIATPSSATPATVPSDSAAVGQAALSASTSVATTTPTAAPKPGHRTTPSAATGKIEPPKPVAPATEPKPHPPATTATTAPTTTPTQNTR